MHMMCTATTDPLEIVSGFPIPFMRVSTHGNEA
ncbi:hypothetical protein BH24CHL3_BH24CHL3_02170 [soil metagenome]